MWVNKNNSKNEEVWKIKLWILFRIHGFSFAFRGTFYDNHIFLSMFFFQIKEFWSEWNDVPLTSFFFCYCFIRTTLLITMKYAWNVCRFLHHQHHQTPQVYIVLLRWYLHKYSENSHRNKMWKRIENSYDTNVLLMNENPKREYKMNESWSFLWGTWCKES